ncbi:beta strand repeat-containing protein, partial [bacterium endosymbiont of Bathymodiolus sp. 5 South]|uniref:beta strand repeat-containing protein n=1 Tax=bacterium endosymbiont of Bathymodiolus sp. 5 South TaxID=1181670 RepID=UPI0010B599F1
GEAASDYSGHSVSNAGDVNGDGLDDLIVGAYQADLSGKSDAGKSYIVFGKQDTDVINLSTIVAGTGGFVINGESAGDWSGCSVSNAGDVNGDGLDDLIVGAHQANLSSGKSYVVFGKQDTNTIELSAIAAGTGGFVINGESEGDWSGYSVSNAGDVNGDGLDDLIVGAYRADPSGKISAGKSYVVFGKKDNTNAIELSAIAAGTSTDGFVINGESADDYSGRSVSSAGDMNGDGLDDLIVSAWAADLSDKTRAGKSYVVFGKQDNTAINLSAIAAGTGGFVIKGESVGDLSGYSVSSAGDVNGDGLDDLIIGAINADASGASDAGKSYVVFGKQDNATINLSAITAGTGGFVINGESRHDYSGFSVSSAGDVNGDGLDDLIVGAYYANPSDKSNAGKSYVVFGKQDNAAINLSAIAAGTGGFVINGESVNDWSGYSVSSAGDVNGDGLDDLIVSAQTADPNNKSYAGKSYVIFGKTDTGAIDLSKLGGGSKYTIDYLGDENANTLTSTTTNKAEIFVAGAGNDTLTGNGGMDVFNAGLGSDTIIINASNITALEQTGAGNRARADGGGGIDTLKLEGAGLTLDLTKISNRRIQDIEVIDITGSGNNILTLNLDELLDASTSTNILKVLGNSGDKVYAAGFGDSTIDKTVDGITYDVYTHDDANTNVNAELWIQKGVMLKGIQRGFVINGESKDDFSALPVSSAGDVNGDGLDDLIIGAHQADPSGKLAAGKSYVVFGKTNSSAINLSAIADASNPLGGFVINGEAAYDWSGFSVSCAGDVNGDGLDDLIVGAWGSGQSDTGKSYVVFGKANSSAINLSAIADASNPLGGFVINGEAASDYSGYSVSSAGDVNGDGLDDLIVGAWSASPSGQSDAGKSYVVFGKTNSSAINLSAIANANNPTGGFVINGEVANDYSGYSVSSAGDVNGDGLDDLIVGAYQAELSGKTLIGKSYVVFGKANNSAIDLSVIADASNPTGGFVINGEAAYDYSGFSVSSAGDVNGDGLDDLIVGAKGGDLNNITNVGKSYVVFGKANSSAINLSAIADASNPLGGFVIHGETAGDFSGFSVSSAGDVNGDGLDDLIVGAWGAPSGQSTAGKSYVVFGKTNNNAVNLSAIADANTPTGGFVIHGEAWGDRSGFSVSSAGDVNGDGLDDLIVGAKYADLSDKPNAGKSYVIFGKTDTNAIDLIKLGGNSQHAIDYLGDKNANTLAGTSRDEIFVAGAGNDTLTGNGGMDVFNAGLGTDSILINASNITALEQTGTGNRARVNGGGGVDTLKLDGADLTLDLTSISNTRIQDIEIIDIRGSGDNTLKLNLNNLLDASTSTNILKVLGDSGDTVNISDFVKAAGITKTEGGITYDVYTHGYANTNAKAALWIQQGISVNDLPPVIDLDPMAGIQSSSSVIANTAQITAGIAFNADIEDAADMDIKTIKVVLGGAGLNEVNDKLILDAELALNADFAKVTGKTIG